MIEYALKVAEKSTHHQHQLGAVVFRGGAVVSTAANLERRFRCAETRALKKFYDPGRYKGASLVVVRSNRGCSKPCKRCMKHIRDCGIVAVYYFNWNGEIEKMKVE